jgi:hypothetical protein
MPKKNISRRGAETQRQTKRGRVPRAEDAEDAEVNRKNISREGAKLARGISGFEREE